MVQGGAAGALNLAIVRIHRARRHRRIAAGGFHRHALGWGAGGMVAAPGDGGSCLAADDGYTASACGIARMGVCHSLARWHFLVVIRRDAYVRRVGGLAIRTCGPFVERGAGRILRSGVHRLCCLGAQKSNRCSRTVRRIVDVGRTRPGRLVYGIWLGCHWVRPCRRIGTCGKVHWRVRCRCARCLDRFLGHGRPERLRSSWWSLRMDTGSCQRGSHGLVPGYVHCFEWVLVGSPPAGQHCTGREVPGRQWCR